MVEAQTPWVGDGRYDRRPWERAVITIVSLFGPPGGVAFSYLVIIKSMTHTLNEVISCLIKPHFACKTTPFHGVRSDSVFWVNLLSSCAAGPRNFRGFRGTVIFSEFFFFWIGPGTGVVVKNNKNGEVARPFAVVKPFWGSIRDLQHWKQTG